MMPKYNNKLLQRASSDDLAALGPLERLELPVRTRIGVSDEAAYFIEYGVASVIADADGKPAIELGIVGSEGMVGLAAIYEDALDPFTNVMQVEGVALRVDGTTLQRAMTARPTLRTLLLRFARAFSIQVSSTALVNGRSKLDERLARWLLMVSDRVGPHYGITHEFISVMLGVRRSGVTLAIQMLEGEGLIRATRGSIAILDRDGLIEAANGAYGFAEQHYQRLLGGS